MSSERLSSLLILGLLSLCVPAPAHAFGVARSALPRAAVVVGSNAAGPAAPALRFAHRDAERMADVLTRTAGFSPKGVTLLANPAPDEVLRAVDQALADLSAGGEEALLLFYFSGHADAAGLYTGGAMLPLATLKSRLETGSGVRVGIVDACGGGGWTQTKGLSTVPPFEVTVPAFLGAEGTVYLAASSGTEAAHESGSLEGSYFTHHLVAALGGAGDADEDGIVTVTEAYAYARERTARDSLVEAGALQRPSFALQLRGRNDLPLARPAAAPSRLEVSGDAGAVRVLSGDTGLAVAEIPAGRGNVLLALPPGRYLVTVEGSAGVRGGEVQLRAGARVHLAAGDLDLLGAAGGVPKGPAAPTGTVPRGGVELGLGLGVIDRVGVWDRRWGTPSGHLSLVWGVTDRLSVNFINPSASWRFGEAGETQTEAWGGIRGWGMMSNVSSWTAPGSSGWEVEELEVIGRLGLGAEHRRWIGGNATLDLYGSLLLQVGDMGFSTPRRTAWGALGLGFTWEFGWLTLSPRLSVEPFWDEPASEPGLSAVWLSVGSIGYRGLRPLPLMRIHVTERFGVDGFAWMRLPFGADPERRDLGPELGLRLGVSYRF